MESTFPLGSNYIQMPQLPDEPCKLFVVGGYRSLHICFELCERESEDLPSYKGVL